MTGGTGPDPAAGAAELMRGRLLARNTMWSLLGQATPMVAAAVAVPLLLHALGTEAFGVLSISWMSWALSANPDSLGARREEYLLEAS
jgi:hypothetical protein